MNLPADTVGIVAVGALGAVVLLAAGLIVVALRLRALRQAYASALDPSRREDLFQSVQRQAGELEDLRRDLGVVHDNTERLRVLLRGAVSRVGLVRYDAFEDMGGALSFSAALLDEHGHGVVLSAINGRSETRAYAKRVVSAKSESNLSEEEVAAVTEAMAGRAAAPPSDSAGPRRSRRRAAS